MTKKISKPDKANKASVKSAKNTQTAKKEVAKKKVVLKKTLPQQKAVNKIVQKEVEKEEVIKKVLHKEIAKKDVIKKEAPKKERESKNGSFKAGDHAFYPSHGVGKILQIDTIEVGSQKLSILIMYFEKERLTIKIPANQIIKTGLRPLISKTEMEGVFDILRSGVKKLKGMWSRRAQEYEAKINSGNIILLAEVLRDLTRDIEDGDRSYSERIIYETAINRLSLEYSVIDGILFEEAKEKIISTAKHKLGHTEEAKPVKDAFDDEFDAEEEHEDEDEDEDGDEDDDDDDDKPKKRGRKKKK